MIGSNTDKVEIPLYLQAVSHILKLATPLFQYAMLSEFGLWPGEAVFDAWWYLRLIAKKFLDNRDCGLSDSELEKLRGALAIAHVIAHTTYNREGKPEVPRIMDCDCPVAHSIRDLMIVMECEETAVQDASR